MGKTTRKLEVVSPVPADIDIANSVEPLHISEIAQELNLNPQHYDLYGKYKAKVLPFFTGYCCMQIHVLGYVLLFHFCLIFVSTLLL